MKPAWMTLEAFWQYCRLHPVSPLLRLLLSSDGSMVRSVTGLFLTPTIVEVIDQSERPLNDESAARLGLPAGEKAIDRRVWLTVEAGASPPLRLLFARSLFPISNLMPELDQAMRLGENPIGTIIEKCGFATGRDRLEIAHLPFPEVARGLDFAEDTFFWARRYRLTISGRTSAFISEVLSPQLSSFSS